MASEIRVNTINNRSGLGTISITNSGAVFSGVTTFAQIQTTSGEVTVGTGASVYSPATNVLALGTNNAERVRITSSGNVGIGTDNPTTKLYATDTQNGYVSYTFVNDSNGSGAVNRIQLGNDASPGSAQLVVYGSQHSTLPNVFDINNANNNDMRLLTNNTERLRITSGGNVGIGTDNPPAKLSVDGSVIFGNTTSSGLGGTLRIVESGNSVYIQPGSNTSNDSSCDLIISSTNGVTEKLRITSSGNVGIDQSSPRSKLDVFETVTGNQTAIRIGNTNTPTSANDKRLEFVDGTGTSEGTNKYTYGYVQGYREGGSNSGALIFGTKPDNASAPSERLRITSSGNVGIGTDDPRSLLSLHQTGGGFEVNANSGSNNARLLSYDRSASAYREMTFQALSYGFEISGSEKLRITSGGNVQIANGNLVFSTSGTGIDFSATSDASGMTSELLDDYEEGSWTPTFNNAGTATYGVRLGRYVKVGNLVYATCHLDIASKNTASGNLVISGLPYTSANVSNMYGVSSSVHGTGWTTARRSLNILLSQNSTTTNSIYHNMTATTQSSNPSITGSDWGLASHDDLGTGNLLFSITYQAA